MASKDFLESLKQDKIKIIAKPSSSKNEVLGFDPNRNGWKIAIKAAPEDGKANAELLKFLYKEYKIRFEITSGFTSKEKILRKI